VNSYSAQLELFLGSCVHSRTHFTLDFAQGILCWFLLLTGVSHLLWVLYTNDSVFGKRVMG
jgi:hypothetical protein